MLGRILLVLFFLPASAYADLPVDLATLRWQAKEGFTDADRFGLTGETRPVPGFPVSLIRLFQPGLHGQTLHYGMSTSLHLTERDLKSGHLALFLRGLGDNWEFFVNGHSIHKEMFLDNEGRILIRRTSMGRMVSIESQYLLPGPNTIVFHLVGAADPSARLNDAVPGFFFSEDYMVGPTTYLQSRYSERIDLALMGVYLFFGLYHLLLYAARRIDAHYLYFGLFCTLIAVYSFSRSYSIYSMAADSALITRLENLSISLLIPLFYSFLQTYLYPGARFGRLLTALLAVHFSFTALFLVMPITHYSWVAVPWKYLALATIALYSPFYIVQSVRKRARDARVLAAGLSIFLAFTLFDLIRDALGVFAMELLFPYAFFAFVIAVAGMLALRLIQVFNEKDALNSELENSNAALRNMDRLKDEFINTISHEIRTPLNGIIGLTEALAWDASRALDAETLKTLRLVSQSGRRLSRLVTDLIEFIQLKNRQVPIQPSVVHLSEAVDITLSLLRPLVKKASLTLHNEISQQLPAVYADPDRLQQILSNLIWNAVKFTEDGTVTITASSEQSSMVRVYVKDTGIGVPREKQQIIFEAFRQADSSVNRSHQGIGLGLSITKHLVELHGGTIAVESEEGRGSVFYFDLPAVNGTAGTAPERLPQRAIREETPVREAARSGHGLILIIDDEAINLEVLHRQLQLEGYEVISALGGEEALKLMGSRTPDVVVCDVMMPRMSGYDVCQEIRKSFTLHELPVLLLTARTQLADILRGFDAGANDYLTKPYEYRELSARLRSLLTIRRTAKEKAAVAALDKELTIARDIQRSVIPKHPPVLEQLDIAARFRPRESVGGDFYDFMVTTNRLEILIADVSGHGVPAALITAMLKIAFAQDKDVADPAERLDRLNRALTGNLDRHFVTAMAVHIEPATGRVSLASAGHPALLRISRGHPAQHLTARGKVMGLLESPGYKQTEFELRAGDALLLYTDGLTEARNPAGELFGEDRLVVALEALVERPAEEIASTLENQIVSWSNNTLEDDVAFIVVKAAG